MGVGYGILAASAVPLKNLTLWNCSYNLKPTDFNRWGVLVVRSVLSCKAIGGMETTCCATQMHPLD